MSFAGLILGVAMMAGTSVSASDQTSFTRTQDVIYSRPDGTALTMDIFEPAKPNGAGVIWLISGGWFSSHGGVSATGASPVPQLTSRGYRVYAVVHRSSPRFTIEDAVADVHRAIRFIRTRAAKDGETSMPLGITGGSAGGHLSLMAGTTGDDGDPNAKDAVERASSRVQAVACYFPPTDFLNYGDTDVNVMETTVGKMFPASFDFQSEDSSLRAGRYDDVTDNGELNRRLAEVSPARQISPDDAPTLIIHGDSDQLVPLQQSELMIDKLRDAGVDAKLVIKKGAGHGWRGVADDSKTVADWLDAHLL